MMRSNVVLLRLHECVRVPFGLDVNLLSPEKKGRDFKCVNFKHSLRINVVIVPVDITLE